ncbi:hypothetical protein ABFS83_08G189100 [Erythranthe nasuta]
MEDPNNETDLEINYNSEASMGDKRKRDTKLRSKVWQHFTKITREDGRCEKCQCNHCQKLFTCSSRSGTTHLLRHITDGICPVFKKDSKTLALSNYVRGGGPYVVGQSSGGPHCADVDVEFDRIEDEYQTPLMHAVGRLPEASASRSPHSKGEAWMNEFRGCVAKLVELANGKIPVGSIQLAGVGTGLVAPDYSISAALKCLNEMEDIPQSSEMYLDAFEILQDIGERECFICLPPEPRRRWLQRVMHRRHPLRYGSNI